MASVTLSVIQRFELGENNVKARYVAKIEATVSRWRIKPPAKRQETRGGWKRGMRKVEVTVVPESLEETG